MAQAEGTAFAIEPQAMTSALREAGVLPAGRVTHVEPVGSIGLGRGYAGRTERVEVRYESANEHAPPTLIVKRPSIDPAVFAFVERDGGYTSELGFYDDLASDCPVRVPRCYGKHEFASARHELYLEDLGGWHTKREIDSCSLEEAKRIVDMLAELHAHYWRAPELERLEWLQRKMGAQLAERDQGRALDALPYWQARFAPDAGDPIRELARRIVDALPALRAALDTSPWTLTHGDVRLENMLFAPAGGAEIVLLDWQGCGLGPGGYDVAYFVRFSLSPELIRDHAESLLRRYHAALTTRTGSDLAFESLRDDYRRSLLADLTSMFYINKLVHPVRETMRALTDPELRTAYETNMASFETLSQAMHERCLAAIEASDATALLPG